ncbi:large-conductance mechanosensitive channel [Ruminococcus sp. CAG:382]|jgi:large conductance mechanosensitive channel protein|nr:large conductance mechanosensitive channel protein MscL [Ruminococcus sp.]CDD01931.1 large-conductance mechanosensitive channel [Ruminococcus sp. CAG:382]
MSKKNKSTFFKDFKAFIAKGNVLDMAVGVVVGGAFGKITTSLVNDIINPLIGLLVGKEDLSAWVITLKEAVDETTPAVTLNIGSFISTILDFLIISLSIFCVLRVLMKAKAAADKLTKKEAEEEEKSE